MARYIIYFNQQWVGEHSPEWFASRGPLVDVVINEAKAAGVFVAAGGVDEDANHAYGADAKGGSTRITQGLIAPAEQHIGGLTIIEAPNEREAQKWAGMLAEACGWPQQVRPLF